MLRVPSLVSRYLAMTSAERAAMEYLPRCWINCLALVASALRVVGFLLGVTSAR
ncbi:hypothetical protein D3C72_2239710 [compost metagenome]